ncbi:MAG TPA: histidine kinase [Bacteroidales bacterium]
MQITRKFLIKHLLVPVVAGAVFGLFLTLIFNWSSLSSWESVYKQSIYSIILTFLFWKGNEFIIRYYNNKYSWIKDYKKIITRHIVFSSIYTLSVIFLFYFYIWFFVMHKKTLHGFYSNFNEGFFICLCITAIAMLLSYSYYFFRYWKKAVLNEEQLKRESLTLQYESLKNQVNPHFLFNSLNILTSLIERDTNASITYVKQLSDVFRYVLDQNVRELVPIETELKFIDSYNFLQHIRFNDNFRIDVHVNEKNFLIVPLALQILIENAVKHNEISTENPLHVSISDDDNYLYISNNKQPRSNLPDSNQIGLKTLNFQYEFLSGKKIEVQNEEHQFLVKLPKIKM